MTKKATVISAFSNTSGKQIFTKTFYEAVQLSLVEQYHASNSRLVVKNYSTAETLFVFDFNPLQVSIVQDFILN